MSARLHVSAVAAAVALLAAPVVSLPAASASPRPVEPEVAVVDLPDATDATTRIAVPDGAAVMGVTWEAGAQPEAAPSVEVRALRDGEWSPWLPIPAADDAPDPGTPDAERAAREGGLHVTDPVDVLGAAKVEVRTSNTGAVDNLEAALIDPGASPADATAAGGGTPVAAANAAAAMPGVVSRRAWGADESLRSCTPSASGSLKGVIVHHTAGKNGYSRAEAPSIVRSIYAYHTKVRNWCDVGYNALIDRYGTIYEGRYGGLNRNVNGAHAGGFNRGTWGVSVMGNFDVAALPAAAQASLERLVAWRLGVAGLDPVGSMRLTSAGSTRYAAGKVVTLPVIAEHRDVSLTACPGRYYSSKMASVRSNVKALAGVSTPARPADPTTHVVVSGDTLAKIAARYDTTVAALRAVNRLSGDLIRVGQRLTLPPAAFVDVPPDHPFGAEISWLADRGITVGAGDGTVFDTRSPVQRQHMAAFLYRMAAKPDYRPPSRPRFSDVPKDHSLYTEISWLADNGITLGLGDGSFGTTAPVQRQQMAGFLHRLSGDTGYRSPATAQFTDVPRSAPLYDAVSWLADRGITKGVSATVFDARGSVQRQHMAAFLYRYSR